MLVALLAIQGILLILLLALFLRKPALVDERTARLPEAVASLAARLEGTEAALRGSVADLRREQAEAAHAARAAAELASRSLREEISGSVSALSRTLHDQLNGFRTDNASSSDRLSNDVGNAHLQMVDRLTSFASNAHQQGIDAQITLHRKLDELSGKNTESHQNLRDSMGRRLVELAQEQREDRERLRATVAGQLEDLSNKNEIRLEQMRKTVDEKLDATLNERLTTSFGQVTTHLGEVQKGLGEMRELATGVSDLKKVFSNVKARGIVGEFQLGMQLEQMFSREQYEKNVEIREGSGERVEFALKVPQGSGTALFAIDSKFPREDWERLQDARESGNGEDIRKAGDSLERAIRAEGKRICEKYIFEPVTLPHAILFVPTEGLYAEIMQRPGLQLDLQQRCNVTIAGPSTLTAILTSFRMGFHTIQMERKGREIEQVLGRVKTEFGNFGDLLAKAEKQVGTVQNTLHSIRGKTTTITRNLRGVSELPAGESNGNLIHFEEIAGVAPLLAAGGEDA